MNERRGASVTCTGTEMIHCFGLAAFVSFVQWKNNVLRLFNLFLFASSLAGCIWVSTTQSNDVGTIHIIADFSRVGFAI